MGLLDGLAVTQLKRIAGALERLVEMQETVQIGARGQGFRANYSDGKEDGSEVLYVDDSNQWHQELKAEEARLRGAKSTELD